MTPEQLAAALNGREYGHEITKEEEAAAKAAGLVVAFGYSDDNVELRGAINEEVGAYDGTTLRIGPAGLLPSWDSIDKEDEREAEDYFLRKHTGYRTIEAIWAPKCGASWEFVTTIPTATFTVMEDGELYCRGIVFRLIDTVPALEGSDSVRSSAVEEAAASL